MTKKAAAALGSVHKEVGFELVGLTGQSNAGRGLVLYWIMLVFTPTGVKLVS